MPCAAGFVIKPISLPGVVLNVKEIGGAPVYRPYWSRYYQDVAGVVSRFTVSSLSSTQ